MDLREPKDRTQFEAAVRNSFRMLRPWRENRTESIKQYVGKRYSEQGADRQVMLNLLAQTADVYTMALAAQNPRVLIQTFSQQLKPMAARFKVATNNLLKEIQFAITMQEIVHDAFFCLGIGKAQLVSSKAIEIAEGVWADPGKPYFGSISFDSWVHDTSATKQRNWAFCGDQYLVPLRVLKEDDRFDQGVVAKLGKQYPDRSSHGYGPDSSDIDSDRAARITGDNEQTALDYEQMIPIWDFWLPREGLIVTVAGEINGEAASLSEPLMVTDYDGPEGGPYHLLSFSDVPDNVMPVSPAAQLHSLHMLVNALLRKLAKEAQQSKTVYPYRGHGEDDMRKLLKTSNMETVRIDGEPLPPLVMNALDGKNLAFAMRAAEWFNEAGGNVKALAGLGPQADTATQDQMIQSNVSQRIAKMQQRVVNFSTEVIRDLAWMMWVHPTLEVPGTRQIAGTDIHVDASWTPEHREGDFFSYNFDIEPYSMPYQSPTQRVAELDQLVDRMLNAGPMLAEQGGSIDFQKYLSIRAEYRNQPETLEILKFQEPLPEERTPTGEMPAPGTPKPANTKRTYERVNRSPGPDQQGQDEGLINKLMGGGSEPEGTTMLRGGL